jgi:antitoxin component YwqK of YwqJK toxin-antitoxin module
MIKRLIILLTIFYSCTNRNKVEKTWEDGSPKEIRNYEYTRDSIKYIRTLFYKNGKIKEIGMMSEYLDTLKYGEWKYFYKTGKLKMVENYVEGVKWGEYLEYHKNGFLKLKSWYNNKGRFEGDYEEFYPNGISKVSGLYVDGEKSTTWFYKQHDGKLSKVEYIDQFGRVNKEVVYANNYKKIITEYESNVLKSLKNDSFWTYYYTDGSVMKEGVMLKDSFRLINFWDNTGEQIVKDGKVIKDCGIDYFGEDHIFIELENFTDDI